jgi:hypothetical protein
MNKEKSNLDEFLKDLNYIREFLESRFGIENILIRKNGGAFLDRDDNVRESKIKSYAFHGNGCFIRFNSFFIDVDLRYNAVSFNKKTLQLYFQSKDIVLTDLELLQQLDILLSENVLEKRNELYVLKHQ